MKNKVTINEKEYEAGSVRGEIKEIDFLLENLETNTRAGHRYYKEMIKRKTFLLKVLEQIVSENA